MIKDMKPVVSIIMGSTSDLPVMEKACKWLNDNEIPFEVNALSAHRTPDAVETFAKEAKGRGIRVIIAAAGMAAALPGVIAASTTLPVRDDCPLRRARGRARGSMESRTGREDRKGQSTTGGNQGL